MKTKASVVFRDPHPGVRWAMDVVDLAWRRLFEMQATITSGGEGEHSETSRHYGVVGDVRERAFDVRTHNLTQEQRAKARAEVRRLLGPLYDVVLEPTHLHIEVELDEGRIGG